MMDIDEITPNKEPQKRSFITAGYEALRISLLFGSAALALALIAVPIMMDRANKQEAQSLFNTGLDMTKTGSINNGSVTRPLLRHPDN